MCASEVVSASARCGSGLSVSDAGECGGKRGSGRGGRRTSSPVRGLGLRESAEGVSCGESLIMCEETWNLANEVEVFE